MEGDKEVAVRVIQPSLAGTRERELYQKEGGKNMATFPIEDLLFFAFFPFIFFLL